MDLVVGEFRVFLLFLGPTSKFLCSILSFFSVHMLQARARPAPKGTNSTMCSSVHERSCIFFLYFIFFCLFVFFLLFPDGLYNLTVCHLCSVTGLT